MGVLLDTRTLSVANRVEAAQAILGDTEVPTVAHFTSAAGELWHQISAWDLGSGVHVTRVVGTGARLVRGSRQIRVAAPERVGLGLQLGAPGSFTHCGTDQVVAVGELGLTDGTSTSDFAWTGVGGTNLVIIDYDELGLPADTVRSAATQLKRSPLYGVVAAHLAALGDEDGITSGPARAMLRSATTQLVRALIITAAGEEQRLQQTPRELMYLRITAYVEHHVRDPRLNAGSVASAHGISVRQLYNIWSSRNVPLAQWIMAERLAGARDQLARSGRSASVAAVARHWGFVDAGHFARRFRAAYGVTPREWMMSCPGS